MKSHGSARACYDLRLPEKCEDCKAAARERLHRDGQNPGTYRYNAIHGIGHAGEKRQDHNRWNKRRVRISENAEKLAAMTEGAV